MILINFAPRNYVEKIYSGILIAKSILAGFLILIVVSILSVMHYMKYSSLLEENKVLTKEYNMLQSQVDLSKRIEKDIAEVGNYIAQVEKLNKDRYLYVAFMQDLVNNLPITLWFSGIDTRVQSGVIDVRINVNSNNLEDLLWWFSYLDNNKRRYSDAKITGISYNSDYYTTQISFKYRYSI